MARLVTTVVLLFFGALLHAQTDTVLNLKLLKTIEGDIANFETDHLNNIYLISKQGQIKKLNANTDSVGQYNNIRQFGQLYSVDVSNPLKLVLFYKDFATIVLTDRFLNVLSTINLRKLNIVQCSAVALSYDNMVWVFDNLDNKIKKVDDAGTVVFESTDLRMVLNNNAAPTTIIDSNGLLYLYNATTGLQVFDYYGALKNQFGITNIQNLSINNSICTGTKNDSLFTYNLKMFTGWQFVLPASVSKSYKLQKQNNKYFSLQLNSLKIYTN